MAKRTISSYDYNKSPQGVSFPLELKMDKRTRRFLEAIRHLRKPKILEVGMGQGRFLRKIASFRPDARLFGVDISKTAIATARKDPLFKGNLKIGNAENLPYLNNSFDVVVIMDVLEHVNNPEKVISEVYRVLKPGGVFHLYVPCENQPLTLDRILRRLGILSDFTKVNFGHTQYFTHDDIRKIVSIFELKKFSYSDHLLSQLAYFLILYVPKSLILRLGKEQQFSDRNFSVKRGKFGLKLARIIWYAFVDLPISIISEIEAYLFRNQAFMAKGLHFTGRKIIRKN